MLDFKGRWFLFGDEALEKKWLLQKLKSNMEIHQTQSPCTSFLFQFDGFRMLDNPNSTHDVGKLYENSTGE